jgi:hypothetical protein
MGSGTTLFPLTRKGPQPQLVFARKVWKLHRAKAGANRDSSTESRNSFENDTKPRRAYGRLRLDIFGQAFWMRGVLEAQAVCELSSFFGSRLQRPGD